MRHDEQDRPTWDGEAIADAVGRQLARRSDAALWSNESFLEWLGTERRALDERRTRGGDAEMAMRRDGARLRTRLLARQSGVTVVNDPPRFVAPTTRGLPAEVMEEASAAGAAVCVNLAAAAGSGRALWDEPAEQWVALPGGAPRRRTLALRIAGESMAPLLRSGDMVLVELGPTLSRGRLVVARHAHPEDGYVCKHVERVGRKDVLLTSLDSAYGSVTIPRDARLVVGTVRMVWRADCPVSATDS
jgi:phage repressor protein C with HTH and peptisase S24 domain